MLDLGVLTAARILFDEVIALPAAWSSMGYTEPPTGVTIPDYTDGGELALIFCDVWEVMSRPGESKFYGDRWAAFLGDATRDPPLNFGGLPCSSQREFWDHAEYFARADWESAATAIMDALAHNDDAASQEALAVALALQTVRAGFNDAVAARLGIPYLGSAIRLPVTSDLADQKTHLLWVLQQLIAISLPSGRIEPAQFGPRSPIGAPLLLGLVLELMTQPDDYDEAVSEVRERFAPLRAAILEDRVAAGWDEKPQRYIARYTKHLGGAQPSTSLAGDAGLATVQAGLSVGTAVDPTLITAGLKVIRAIKPLELAHTAYLRIWRPEIFLLTNIAKEARDLSLLSSRIERIWGAAPSAAQQREYDRFRALHPGPFLGPVTLDAS